jgi:DNA repair protein SbcD/Mre11
MKKIIHTADLHLGAIFKELGEKSKIHRMDCRDVFTNIIDLCIKEKVDALLIAGDLFDKAEPQKSLVNFVISELERLEQNKTPVFISTGNHDPYKKNSVWLEHKFPKNVIIFDSSNLEAKSIDGITIYGIAYTNNDKEPLKGFKADDSDNFKIGLVHGSTTNINWDEQPEAGYRRIMKSDLDNSKLDYIALGHFHSMLEVKSKSKCFYPGSPEPLSFKNKGDCFVILASMENKKLKIEPIRMNIKTFDTIEVDCTSFDSDSEIRKILEKNKSEDKMLRLILKGSPSLDTNIDIEILMKNFEQKYFYLKVVDNIHLPRELIEDETIRGNFIKIIRDKIKEEKDAEEKKRLENALRVGVGYLDKNL